MLESYKKRSTLLGRVKVEFYGEDAVGDGVTRDAYSEFFEALYSKMDGYVEKVPSSQLKEEELELIGKIINHAFVCYNIFPHQLSKCSLSFNLFSCIEDDTLIQSFLQFLLPNEAKLFKDFSTDESVKDVQPLVDILFDYDVYDHPSREKMPTILINAGKAALIKSPMFAMRALIKGMGSMWQKMNHEMIFSLYGSTKPTAQKIIESLDSCEKVKKESTIITWLHRFLRSCGEIELEEFMRFTTGGSVFVPNMTLQVQFIVSTIIS